MQQKDEEKKEKESDPIIERGHRIRAEQRPDFDIAGSEKIQAWIPGFKDNRRNGRKEDMRTYGRSKASKGI